MTIFSLRTSTRIRKQAQVYDGWTGNWKPIAEANIAFGNETDQEVMKCTDYANWTKGID